jgi:hypothetical protein
MAMLALENYTAAISHFRKPVLAAQHLSRHSVWGAVGVAAKTA